MSESTIKQEFIAVYCTCPSEDVANKIASALVEQRLAACVNILPAVRSVYIWEGATQMDNEQLLMIKTCRDRYTAVEVTICAQHPYELPEVIAVPLVGGSRGYLKWIHEMTRRSV